MKVNACSGRAWVSVTTALFIAMSAFGSHSSTAGAADIRATLKTDQKGSPVRSAESDRGSITVGAGKSLSGTVTTSSPAVTGGQDQEWAPRQSALGVIALMQTGDTYRIPANAKLSDAQVVIFEDVPPPVLPLFFVAAACFMVPLGLMRITLSHGIVWGAAWQQGSPSTMASRINQFFDGILTSALINQLSEYSVPGKTIGHGRRIGTTILTKPKRGHSISDSAIQHMLQLGNIHQFCGPASDTEHLVLCLSASRRAPARMN
jgi:hypothetical protein